MKKRSKTLPTLVGIVVLLLGIASGVFLIESSQVFRLRANPESAPRDIRISNITHDQATISWTSAEEVLGFVTWGGKSGNLENTSLSIVDDSKYIHLVVLEGLEPESTYYFKISSDGSVFDNEGIPWTITTGSLLSTPPQTLLISGKVVTSAGAPAKNALVYVTVGGSSLLSSIITEKGTWVVPISQARTKNLSSVIPINESETLVEISVQGGPLGVASAQIYPETAKPAPTIILGQTHNFKSIPAQADGEIPDAKVELPADSSETLEEKES